MTTERGWAALGAGLALLVLWLLLGEPLLAALGFLMFGAVATGRFGLRRRLGSLHVSRRLRPGFLEEGEPVTVELTISDSPGDLLITDRVGDLGAVTFRVGPGTGTGRYSVTCHTRGIYPVGPAEVVRSDAFGFNEVSAQVGAADRVVVYPAIEDLAGLPTLRGADPSLEAARPEAVQRGGDEFFALREYQTGDDLRRVHWPSTARRDELMIRQFETPWEPRAFVVLDPRAEVYATSDAFETAVRGAASAVHHFYEEGVGADLWAGAPGGAETDYETIMLTLAALQPARSLDLRTAVLRLRLKGRGGTLVLVTGTPDGQALAVVDHLSRHAGATLVMAACGGVIPEAFQSATVVQATPGTGWTQAWMETWSFAGAG